MRWQRAAGAMAAGAMAAVLAGCQPGTTRPAFVPAPEAATAEVRLPPRDATRLLAEALEADAMPMTRVNVRDAWLETRWFDSASGRAVRHRPIGTGVVKVRAWADPTHPGNSKVTVETVYRPLADPSLPERELDRQVPRSHPVAVKVRAALQDLVKRYGGPPAPVAPAAAGRDRDVEGPPDLPPGQEPPEEAPPEQGAPGQDEP